MSNAEIKRTPTIGMAREMVAAVRIAKMVFIKFTFIPETWAAS